MNISNCELRNITLGFKMADKSWEKDTGLQKWWQTSTRTSSIFVFVTPFNSNAQQIIFQEYRKLNHLAK